MRTIVATYAALFAASIALGVSAAPTPGTYVHPSTGQLVDHSSLATEPLAIHMAETTIVGQAPVNATSLASATRGKGASVAARELVCHTEVMQAVPGGKRAYGSVQVCR